MINYCNEAQVASALGMNPTTALAAAAPAGSLSLTVVGGTWYPGQRVAIDHFQDDTIGEVVMIQSVNGTTLNLVSPTLNPHVSGAPLVEVTAITKTIASASRMVDALTYYESVGFDQETRTETRRAVVNNDGNIFVSAQKPIVQSVTSLTIQDTPLDTPTTIPVNMLQVDGYQITAYTANSGYVPPLSRRTTVTLAYVGGYSTLPSEIVRSTIVLAARFFKEKDSGFSDVIGNQDLGILQYKKAAPGEVLAMLKPHIRLTP